MPSFPYATETQLAQLMLQSLGTFATTSQGHQG
jgi:hypothetical protein